MFLFTPGTWLGEGTIQLSMLQEPLSFFMRWRVRGADEEGVIEGTQEIQIKGHSDLMVNHFWISSMQPGVFSLFLENHAIGKLQGSGFVKESMIGWEFRSSDVEGFEYYDKKEEEAYLVHAEFATSEQLRTVLRGKIWKSCLPKEKELL